MFNDSDNGQTQYCVECQKWIEEFDNKVEKYINAILLCFAEQIVNDLDEKRDKGIQPFINVDDFYHI